VVSASRLMGIDAQLHRDRWSIRRWKLPWIDRTHAQTGAHALPTALRVRALPPSDTTAILPVAIGATRPGPPTSTSAAAALE
jgi:hypothetical protein